MAVEEYVGQEIVKYPCPDAAWVVPESRIAELEEELKNAINSLNIGPMGGGGSPTVFDIHIEYALTHTAGHPVAVNTQCSLTRRGTVRLYANGQSETRTIPEWFDR